MTSGPDTMLDPRDEELVRLRRRVAELVEANESEAIDGIPGFVATLAPDGGVEAVNRQIIEYTGQPLEELKHWGTNGTVHADDMPHVAKIFMQSIADGVPYEIEQRLRRFDGAYRWFANRGRPIRAPSGRILRWYVLLTDIDEKRQAEEALRARELVSRDIVDNIPIFISLLSPTGEIQLINRQILDYTGRTLRVLAEWTMSDLVHPDDLPGAIARFKKGLSAADPFDIVYRMRRYDGAYRWFEARHRAQKDSEGRVARWCVSVNDIDDRKRAEDALRESERQSRLIINTIQGLIVLFASDGELVGANQQFLEYLGQTFDEVKDWTTNGTVHPEDRARAMEVFSRSLASGDALKLEVRTRRYDGTYRWLEARGLPLRDAEGHIVRWYNLLIDIDDRKRAEEAVRESQRSLQLTIDTIPALAWSASSDGSAEFFNQHYLDFVGLSAEQLHGAGWTNAVHPDDRPRLLGAWDSMMISGQGGETEARLRRFDGEYRLLLFRMNPLRGENGKIIKWYGTNTDIEDRKRSDALLAGEKRLLEMVASGQSLSGILQALCELVENITSDCYCSVLLVDVSGARLEGGAAPSLPQSFCDVIIGSAVGLEASPCATAAYLKQPVISADIASETRWQAEGWCAAALSHGLRACWSTPIMATTGKVLGTFALLFDEPGTPSALHHDLIAQFTHLAGIAIERAQSDAALRERERNLQLTMNTIPALVFCNHADGANEFMNQQWHEFTGLTPEEARGEGWQVTLHPDDLRRMTDASRKILVSGASGEVEGRLRRFDGLYRWFLFRTGAVRDGSGKIVKWYGTCTDIDDRKRAEEALDKARSELAHVSRVSALSVLTASIAHEINQPLSGIITNANTCLRMLAADPPNVDGARKTAQRTIRDGNRAAEVVKRLRALFSKNTSQSEDVDLNEAAAEVIALAASDLQRNRVFLRTDFAQELPRLRADKVQLQQVVLNLLLNASDAMCGVDDRQRLAVITTALDDHAVRLSVQDAGAGFSTEDVERLFQAFYTTKNNGMGIGLSVSRSIIESHDGRLWCELNDGPGATFSFSVPIAVSSGERRTTA